MFSLPANNYYRREYKDHEWNDLSNGERVHKHFAAGEFRRKVNLKVVARFSFRVVL
jgi:hypothetical protein